MNRPTARAPVKAREELRQELDLDTSSELNAVNGPATPRTEEVEKQIEKPAVTSNKLEGPQVSQVPQFEKPEGPKRGGVLRVPHPNAAKGLSRINQDGSYQYKVRMKPKSKSASLRAGMMTPPQVSGATTTAGNKSFKDFYGQSNLFAVNIDYEWQPFVDFGRTGVVFGTGFATIRGNGYFAKDGAQADEVYSLYVLPLSVYADYRFEYARRQWAVPFVKAGLTYFALAELRDDNKSTKFAGAPAASIGAGFTFRSRPLISKMPSLWIESMELPICM